MTQHQYIDRKTGRVATESFYQDRLVQFLYGRARESAPRFFNWLTDRRSTRVLAYLNYDTKIGAPSMRRFLTSQSVDLSECVEDPRTFKTMRQWFERKIRYWEQRPMPAPQDIVVAPADARALLGSFADASALFIKEKFFTLEELLGTDKAWTGRFLHGDFAVFRLTPEKYHYNHAPVSGRVCDIYDIDGRYHSCNPGAALCVATPYSKNRRVVTIIDTDVVGGSNVGIVAMIEIVALMIGQIEQCYSAHRYTDPMPVVPGLFVERGQPKSLFRPGSSTTVLIFEPGRVRFALDLLCNQRRADAQSRYSIALGAPAVETDVQVRSALGHAIVRHEEDQHADR